MIPKYFTQTNENELEPVRGTFLQWVLNIGSIVGGLALIGYALAASAVNVLVDILPHVAVVGLVFFLTFNKKLSYRFRAYATLVGLYVLSVSEIRNNGLTGDGRIVMLTLVALASYLFGFRTGMVAFAIGFVTQVILGVIIPIGWLPMPAPGPSTVLSEILGWQVSSLMFVILTFILVGGGYFFISNLARSLNDQRRLSELLDKERTSLKVQVDEQSVDLKKEIAERLQAEADLRRASTHDALTGLHNRVYFEQALHQPDLGLETPVSILVMDVNGLKQINAECGHSAGDILLANAALVISQAMRTKDIVARTGGDEFAAILPGTDAPAVQKVLARIIFALQQFNAAHADLPPLWLATGSATAAPGEPLYEVMKRADAELYAQKS